MNAALRINPDTLKADDARIHENDSVLVKLRHAVGLARAKVDKANRKSFVVVLDEAVARDDGRVLYPAGTSLRVPRIPSGMTELPTEGYCLLAPANVPIDPREAITAPFPAYTGNGPSVPQDAPAPVVGFKPRGMVATLKETALVSFLAAKERAAALAKELETLNTDLAKQEIALIGAYEGGALPPAGFKLALEIKRTAGRCSPSWKAEAISLAGKLGMGADAYEAEVKARTPKSPDTVTKALVVERAG